MGGGRAPDLDKCTLGNPAKYTYCICENEEASPFAPYHVEKGFSPEVSTVFTIAAEAPHSVTDHQCNDPEGILDTICSAMSTIASNTSVLWPLRLTLDSNTQGRSLIMAGADRI